MWQLFKNLTWKELLTYPYDYVVDTLRAHYWMDGYNRGYTVAQESSSKTLENQSNYILELLDTVKKAEQQLSDTWFVNKEKVLEVRQDGILVLNGRPLSITELQTLKEEVANIRLMSYYAILKETIKQKAIEKAVINSNAGILTNINPELMAGKMMIHNLGIMDSIFSIISNYEVR